MITFEVPARRFLSVEVSILSTRMRALSNHPALEAELFDVPGAPVGDEIGQRAEEWLRARAAELPWCDCTIATYPGNQIAWHSGGSRRAAQIYAAGLVAFVIDGKPEAYRLELSRHALGLIRDIAAVVGALERYVDAHELRSRSGI